MLRSGSSDTDIFHEIFGSEIYAPPAQVERALGHEPVRLVADIGANVGLFAVWALRAYPGARVVSFEPDPANLRILRMCHAASPDRARWDIHGVAAGATRRRVAFLGGRDAVCREALADEILHADRVDVQMADIFGVLTSADLIKIDIEGGEWEILDDPRFTSVDARAVAVEYHPEHCPDLDPAACAAGLLRRAGYAVAGAGPQVDGVGQLWGWRPPAASRGELNQTPR